MNKADMEPVAWMERQMLNTGWSDWYPRTARRKNEPTEITVDEIQYQFSPVYTATQLQQSVTSERLRWSTLLDLKEIELKEAKRVLYQAREALLKFEYSGTDKAHRMSTECIISIDKVLK